MKLKKDELDINALGRSAAHLLSRISRQRIEFKQRWVIAIAKAVAELEQNEYWYFNGTELCIFSATSSGVMYIATADKCQCKASYTGVPCYHRAAAMLIFQMIESASSSDLDEADTANITAAKGQGSGQNAVIPKPNFRFTNAKMSFLSH